MTAAFSISEALASGFRLTRRRPLHIWLWGVVSVAPSLLVGALMLHLFGAVALMDMAASEPSTAFVRQMMQFQALSGLANILQMLIWVAVTAAIFRAVLFPEQPVRFGGLRVGMDEVRVAVVALAVIVAFYVAAIVIGLVAFAIGAGLWFVSEMAAVALGLLTALAAGVAVWIVLLRACLIMPASIALGDFAFVPGWKLTKGQVLRLLGLSLAIVAIILAIELILLGLIAVILFLGAGINIFSLAALMDQGAPPTVDWGVLIPWALAAFVPLSWLQGFLTTVMMAPYAEACRSLLAQAPQDEPRPVALG